MKTKITSLLILILITFQATACNTKSTTATSGETRTLENFNDIDLVCSAIVHLTQGDVQEVRIEAAPEDLEHIITEVKSDALTIRVEENYKTTGTIEVYISVKDLSSLDLAGSGKFIFESMFKTDEMAITVSGSGKVNAMIDIKTLSLNITGSGDITAKGRAAEAKIRISGSGDVDGRELQTFTSSVNITGSGTTTVDVNNELTVNIVGSGNVYYVSDPERINSKIYGSGKLEKIKA